MTLQLFARIVVYKTDHILLSSSWCQPIDAVVLIIHHVHDGLIAWHCAGLRTGEFKDQGP